MRSSSTDQPSETGTELWLPAGVPQQLGQYRLVRALGSGGMGVVYEASHQLLGQRAAVKVMRPQFAQDPGFVGRFRREMALLGKLKDHPNLLRAHYAGEDGGVLYLAMDLVPGNSLSQLLKRGPVPVAEACEIIRQAALGLEAVREVGLVHRDLKPGNLMLAVDGTVKILDLGLARLCEPEMTPGELTPSNQQLGTFDYQAPEQAENARGVDIRADIYSLGCTLYCLLTGRPPFAEHASPARKMYAHAHFSFPALGPVAPAGIEIILGRMTAKDPAQRYATPLEVSEALGPFARGAKLAGLLTREPQPERPPGPATPTGAHTTTARANRTTALEPARRTRLLGMALVLGVLTLLAAVLIWQPWNRPGSDGKDSTAEAETPAPGVKPDGPAAGAPASDGVLPPDTPPRQLDALAPARGGHNLLAVAPVEGYWDRSDRAAVRQYHPDGPNGPQFVVNTSRTALHHLGTLTSRSFTFRVQISQSRWTPGFGVYLGYRETGVSRLNQPVAVFQYLRFEQRTSPEGSPICRLSRGLGKVMEFKGKKYLGWDGMEGEDLPEANHELVLSLTVAGHSLRKVEVNGRELRRLTRDEVNQAFKAADYQGGLGLVNVANSSVYREAFLTVEGR